ncbi:hypothetical protein J6590_072664 [Homalodisca vitripennis]|nr:hypothetical protein J6590_072664 [Homalodisca vitripennis]
MKEQQLACGVSAEFSTTPGLRQGLYPQSPTVLSVNDDCRTVGPRLVLTRVADVTFLQDIEYRSRNIRSSAVVFVRRSPVKPSSKETRESDSRSTVPAWDSLSTPSEAGKKLPRQFYDVDLQSVYRQRPARGPRGAVVLVVTEACAITADSAGYGRRGGVSRAGWWTQLEGYRHRPRHSTGNI